jgi:hypothetical protein
MKRLPTTDLSTPALAKLEALPALWELYQRAQHFARLGDQIKQALPSELRAHVRFSKLEGGKIHLLADTSTWAAKLRMLSFVVLTEVRRLGFNDITELQVRVSRTL